MTHLLLSNHSTLSSLNVSGIKIGSLLHIVTWNVGSATPPDDITSLLGLNVGDGNTDMYIIG
uniref:Uncharacterized protein n=1 Tax=Haplochromis burtoni TaxID=8153 RepID=A0A3Q2WGF1_HAPBU